ncbi:hypothetical protein BX616_000882, partial [Lobosporangium transversale]
MSQDGPQLIDLHADDNSRGFPLKSALDIFENEVLVKDLSSSSGPNSSPGLNAGNGNNVRKNTSRVMNDGKALNPNGSGMLSTLPPRPTARSSHNGIGKKERLGKENGGERGCRRQAVWIQEVLLLSSLLHKPNNDELESQNYASATPILLSQQQIKPSSSP